MKQNNDIFDGLGSIRTEKAPKKTIIVYKLMRLDKGKLFPLFIDRSDPVKVGVWYNADSPELETLKKLAYGYHLVDMKNQKIINSQDKKPSINDVKTATAKMQRYIFKKRIATKDGYYNVGIAKHSSGDVVNTDYALRPGWHAGSLPTMRQIGKGLKRNLRDDSYVWTECKMSADFDYNAKAKANGGELYYIPKEGYYRKCTNANKKAAQDDTVDWYIGGAIKINRIISDKEARDIIDKFKHSKLLK